MGWMKRVNIQRTDEWIFNMRVWFFARNNRKSLASDRCLSYLKKNSESLVLPIPVICVYFDLFEIFLPLLKLEFDWWGWRPPLLWHCWYQTFLIYPNHSFIHRNCQCLGPGSLKIRDFVESIGKICMKRSSWFAQTVVKHKQDWSLNALENNSTIGI